MKRKSAISGLSIMTDRLKKVMEDGIREMLEDKLVILTNLLSSRGDTYLSVQTRKHTGNIVWRWQQNID